MSWDFKTQVFSFVLLVAIDVMDVIEKQHLTVTLPLVLLERKAGRRRHLLHREGKHRLV